MEKDRLSGKLAVILHADIAGSTALVQQDEKLAHERIQNTFGRFSETIEKYQGRVQELRGDALLAEFERASDAVVAAIAFQTEHAIFIGHFDDDLKPTVRIGIAMGEVIIADKTITGAGVVLAQRIEQLAKPGGLCITGAIHEALPQRLPFDQINLGDQLLKGFEEPVRVYTVELKKDVELPEPTTLSGTEKPLTNRWLKITATIALVVGVGLLAWFQPWAPKYDPSSKVEMGFSLPDKPSLAVLPFTNMSDDPSQIYFSDGISEDIITGLSRLKNLVVISRNSSFTFRDTSLKVQDIGKDLGAKYLLEGSVRKAGTQIRITAQLIDTNSGHQLWAERYDRELTDIFAVQDEITERIVSILSIQLTGDEQQQITNSATKSFDAYDLFLQAQISSLGRTKQGRIRAAEILRQAISVDPGFARAYGALAVVLTRLVNAGYSDSPGEMKERSLELAIKAASINPNSSQVQWSLGYVYLYRDQFEKAVEALERAISLSPSYADAYAMLALIKNEMGQAEEAIRLIEKGMDLNPHYSWDYLYNLGRANYALGRYEPAVEYLQQALDRNEIVGQPRLFLAASFVQLGQLDDAEWEVEQVQMTYPAFTLSHLRTIFPITDRELLDKFVTDLTAAGLPE